MDPTLRCRDFVEQRGDETPVSPSGRHGVLPGKGEEECAGKGGADRGNDEGRSWESHTVLDSTTGLPVHTGTLISG
ncbi:hypothetical protein CVA01_00840 [Corynebacterium variabile]|uniref:Uncharacterized protein n=1 Tax=Corynebacterium variabile TaxID=1727 RepID=A0A4Y4C0V2_9CORY|nr:hypothetical protein CVA01_00840 [Corynebacterium variabile]